MAIGGSVIRVLIADDDPLFLVALEQALERLQGIAIVAVAHDGAEAVSLFAETHPDVSIVDLWMPNGNGIEVTERIRRLDRDATVLILSSEPDTRTLARCLDGGARGMLKKGLRFAEYVPVAVAALGARQHGAAGATG